jgi:hypothetical protein
MTLQFSDIARQAATDGTITADEILALRRAGWANGQITLDEAEAIFAANSALATPDGEWCDFFVEAIGEYVVNGASPRGYVSQDNAEWLIAQIQRDDRLCSMTELELLVRVVERSIGTPEVLKLYAMGQIESAVLTGSGPTRSGGALAAGHVSATEAQILRRLLFGPGSDAPAAISRREAELLFRVKDACVAVQNAPEWQRLFVQGVGNYLAGMDNRGGQISRERAAELEAFMDDSSTSIGRFMGRVALSAPNALGVVFGRKATADSDRMARLAQAEQVTPDEQAWLDARIAANGRIDAYDQALLDFLAAG